MCKIKPSKYNTFANNMVLDELDHGPSPQLAAAF